MKSTGTGGRSEVMNKKECYYGKWSLTETQCTNPASYETHGLNSVADGWTWCEDHKPESYCRRLIEEDGEDSDDS